MSKTFVTSDLHFGHDNIIKYCGRPFRDVHEMNEYIVQEWNHRVGDTDTVYILGDVAMGPRSSDPLYITNYLRRLKGKKEIVLGNHDMPVVKYGNKGLEAALKEYPVENTTIVGYACILSEPFVFMSHFPESPDCPYDAVYLHGHAHTAFNSPDIEGIIHNAIETKKYDIGLDMYGGPVELTRDLRHLKVPKGWNV